MKTFVAALLMVTVGCHGDQQTQVEQSLETTAACMQTAAGSGLNCTANDVRIASATNIRSVDGSPLGQCITGTTFSFIADFTVDLTTTSGRFDIGMYFDTHGDPEHDGALTGTCGVNVIEPLHADPEGSPVLLGSSNFLQLDGSPDTCGDADGAHDPQIVTVRVDNVLCEDSDGNGQLNLPNCTSWRQPGSNGVCDGVEDAFPGSPSKCNCDIGFNVPIAVRPPSATASKAFVALLCSDVRYSVTEVNTSDTQALTLTSLVDSAFGDLFAAHGDVLATTCGATTIPVGGSSTCTFDGHFCGGSHANTITATLDDGAGTVLTQVTNTVTVDVGATAH